MASDSGLQQIIGAALVDGRVIKELIQSPLSLADRFGLTIVERRFLAQLRPRNLEHFAALVEGWTNGQPASRQIEDTEFTRVQRVG